MLGKGGPVPDGRYMAMGGYLEYPFSRGSIDITSKDVYAEPDFDAGFLSHPADLSPQIWAYKKNREIVRRMSCFRGECTPTHPAFSAESDAACREPPVSQEASNRIHPLGKHAN